MTHPEDSAAAQDDGRRDFDFLHGRWAVEHRRLKARLAGATDWERFAGTCEARAILGGLGNVDDNLIDLPAGAYRASSIRQFDPARGLWSIWWLDARHPGLAPPVVGRFIDGVGTFTGQDTLRDEPIHVRFIWSRITARSGLWEQAFAPAARPDAWETNWTMQFRREDAAR